jgi:hypothetical protein
MKLCCGKRTLYLEPEEAVLKVQTPCSKADKRMPYGELGSVDHATACGCCHNFTSNLSGQDENGNKAPISPGCGCEADLVQEIVEQLKARMKGRGDTGNIQRAEEALYLTKALTAKVDAIMQKLNVPEPQVMKEGPVVYEEREFDVTSTCFKFCNCGMGGQLLQLEHEEALLTTTTCCGKSTSRRPYGELGSVMSAVACGCCVSVSSELGAMQPGCGCEKDLVDEVVEELKKRMKGRGDTGNIQRQEEALLILRHQTAMVDAMLTKMGIPAPPIPVAPTQKVMG